jgi:hypothetical protein
MYAFVKARLSGILKNLRDDGTISIRHAFLGS